MIFFWAKTKRKHMYSLNGQRATLHEFKDSHHYMEMQHLETKHQWWSDNISINVIDIIESMRPPLIPRVSLGCAHIDWNLGWGRDSTACTCVLEQLRWRLQHTPASPSAGCVFVVRLKVSPQDSLSPEINKLPLWFMNSHLVVTQHQIIQANRNCGYFFPPHFGELMKYWCDVASILDRVVPLHTLLPFSSLGCFLLVEP